MATRIVYRGIRDRQVDVRANGIPLPHRQDICNYSNKFEWGNVSDGAAQLALALLIHALGTVAALESHQHFKFEVISQITSEQWSIEKESIQKWYAHCNQQNGQLQSD